MQRWLVRVVSCVMLTALPACTTSPTAPSPSALPPAATFAGDYALTLQIDEKCVEFPEYLRVWEYSATLEDHGYISIRVLGRAFTEPTVVGQLYIHDNPRFRFVLNFNYDELDHYPKSPELVLYGAGDASDTGSSISGAISGTASLTGGVRVGCAGSHRFMFVRQAGMFGENKDDGGIVTVDRPAVTHFLNTG
jgi:hypothetical protein